MSHNQFISKSYLSVLMQENDYDAVLRVWHDRSRNELPPTDKTAQWAFSNYLNAYDRLQNAIHECELRRTVKGKNKLYKFRCDVAYWRAISQIIDTIITHPKHQPFMEKNPYISELRIFDGSLPHNLLRVVDVEDQLLEIV